MREPPRVVRFGIFEVDLAAGELRRRGRRIDLQEQPFQILRLLLERSGEVVTREELQKAIWPSDTFVEFDRSINTAIKKVRDALGDSAASPLFIETLPRKGYRFIAPLRDSRLETVHAVPGRREQSRARLAIGATVVGLSLLAAIVWLTSGAAGDAEVSAVPLTTSPGEESEPSFSPDETRVAFVWNGPSRDNYDVYVKQIGTDKPIRLTTDAAQDYSPAWSPDGRWIAFGRVLESERVGVFVIPAIGGAERRVTTAAAPHARDAKPFLAWFPDSRSLAISDASENQQSPGTSYGGEAKRSPRALIQVSIDSGQRRQLTFPPPNIQGDTAPALSPNGETLAFVRTTIASVGDIYSVSVAPAQKRRAEPHRLTSLQQHVSNPMWSPKGDEIAFATGPFSGILTLFRLRVSGNGDRPRAALSGQRVSTPAMSKRGRLAYAQQSQDTNIWRLDLSGTSKPKQWIASTWTDVHPRYSPDGKRIVFLSDRDGRKGLWIANDDASDPVQLFSTEARVGAPNWSPGGEWILFDSNRGGNWEVYRIAATGGAVENLTTHPATDCCASWSRDGRSIYFMSTRNGGPQIWKVGPGEDETVPLTREGGHVPVESSDGRFVYYSIAEGSDERANRHRLMRVPVTGGDETLVLSSVAFFGFDVVPEGVYFIPVADAGEPSVIRFHSFATGQDREVLQMTGEPSVGLTVAPDGGTLLYSQVDERKSDLVLVERLD